MIMSLYDFFYYYSLTWVYWFQTESILRPVPFILVSRGPVECSSTLSRPCCSERNKCRRAFSPVRIGNIVLYNLLCVKLFTLAAARYKDSKTLSTVYFRFRKSVFVPNELAGRRRAEVWESLWVSSLMFHTLCPQTTKLLLLWFYEDVLQFNIRF